MRKFLVFILVLFTLSLVGQTKNPTKKAIMDLLRKTYSPVSNCTDQLNCGEWWTVNKDSSFYKSDTIRFFYKGYPDKIEKYNCRYKIWEFNKHWKLMQSGYNSCNEPPLRELEFTIRLKPKFNIYHRNSPDSFYLQETRGAIFLYTFSTKKLLDKYLIIEYSDIFIDEKDQKGGMITLVRQK